MSCNFVCNRNVSKTKPHQFLGLDSSNHKISCFDVEGRLYFDVKDINNVFNNTMNIVSLSNQLKNKYKLFYKSDIFGNYYFDKGRILIERDSLLKFLPLLISYFNEMRGNNNLAEHVLNLCNYLMNEVNYEII